MNEIATKGLPDGVPLVADFNHPYNRLDYYHSHLVEAGVPVPETEFFEVELNEAAPDFDEAAISEYMIENGWKHAFVRGMYASAKLDPVAGSHLHSQDRNDIRRTISELISQHIMMERPLGNRIAVREWIDLDYCPRSERRHQHKTEVRYFIDGGEILYRFPGESEFTAKNLVCGDLFSYVREDLESGVEYPDDLAGRVAREFDELSWSVDFVRDAKTGEWFCPDMGLNGLYWNETQEKWVSISEHETPEQGPEKHSEKMLDRFK